MSQLFISFSFPWVALLTVQGVIVIPRIPFRQWLEAKPVSPLHRAKRGAIVVVVTGVDLFHDAGQKKKRK